MKKGKIVLVWMPQNPLVKKRQPTAMNWKGPDGKVETYYPEEDDEGNKLMEVPFGLAGFTLGRPGTNWKLWEPQKLHYETKTGLGVYTQKVAKSVKPGPKNPEPAHLKEAREQKKIKEKPEVTTGEL